MYNRKRPDSHRFMGGRSHVFCFDFISLGTWRFSTTSVKVVGTVAHQWMLLIINIQRSRTPFAFELRLIPLPTICNIIQTRMNYGINYVSICRTLVFVSHRILPDHCTAEANAQTHDHCQSTCRPFLSNVFAVFFHWMRPSNVYCWRSSCLDLVTAQAIIPQLTSDSVSHTHQMPRVV